MTTFEKLSKRIEKDCGEKLHSFRRTYVGKHQKGCGAWVWVATFEGTTLSIGSVYSATELIKSKTPLEIIGGCRHGHEPEVIIS